MTTRRQLLIALGAGALAAPLSCFGQQQKVWRVGFLSLRSPPKSLDSDMHGAFPRGMRELGYVEGRNLEILWRYAAGEPERLPGLAAELVQSRVDVIVGAESLAISVAQKAAPAIPIVMGAPGDPVGSGFVKSLPRPGGNVTGLSNFTEDLSPKLVDILRNVIPGLSRVALLVNPDNPAYMATVRSVQDAARKVNVEALLLEARSAQEIETAFTRATRRKAGAIILHPDQLFFSEQRDEVIGLAIKNRLPSIMTFRGYAEAGGLMSYGHDWAENFRRAATYVDKIFKGAKPADLPVEQPTRFELHINLKTAKALGIKIPQSILLRADRVIE